MEPVLAQVDAGEGDTVVMALEHQVVLRALIEVLEEQPRPPGALNHAAPR